MENRLKHRTRLLPPARKKGLLQSAYQIAQQEGLTAVNHHSIAKKANICTATVFRYFKTRPELNKAVLEYIMVHQKPSLLRLEAELAWLRQTQPPETLHQLERQIPWDIYSLRRYIQPNQHVGTVQTEIA
ncbi:TetR/AcrR family transcriptional regulator [Celerinatantimonas sp. YJH-8]|uniref:TetR/AcrR family transcriptional regulator n=1 Tax=Celerinatantimonas sp. YJH-8 TaxID=3228714 RepID=UPI0038C88BCF